MKLHTLLQQLQEEALIESVTLPADATGMPWYLKVATAVGAWIATFFLLIFSVAFANSSEFFAFLFGAGQCSLGVLFARRRRSEWWNQLGLSLWLTGCCLVVYGLCSTFSADAELWSSALCLLVLSFLYPERFGQLLTVLLAGLFVVGALCWQSSVPADVVVLLLAFVGGFCCLARATLWTRGWRAAMPVYGTGALLTMMFVLVASYWDWTDNPAGEASALILTLGVLWLVARLLQQIRFRPLAGVWAIVSVIALGAVTYQTPGIMAGVGVLLLGFHVRSRLLQFLAVVFLLVFLSAYYYFLGVPLLQKSLMLFAAGLLLLVLRRGLRAA
jgi:hypothetical protein